MTFSSVAFLFYFLPLFLIVYFLPRNQIWRNVIILLFSLVFYAWGEPVYIFLMVLSIFVNWVLARCLDNCSHHSFRRFLLILALIYNLGTLGFFKYFTFLLQITEHHLHITIPFPQGFREIALPIGISFYTFQALSYIMDVYRKKYSHEKNIIVLGTYISMFPQLIAGPIVRFEQIRDNLRSTTIRFDNIVKGAQLFIIGLSSKVLIANSFAITADLVFSLKTEFVSAGLAWIGAISYLFQIFFDFGGYSIMAIGLGKIIGFTLPMNFNRPYISKSITEFWRRWHMTLSSWFKDYLYIPLGGNRKGSLSTYCNLFIVFVLCGIWHGANWTFLLWGIFHGFFLVTERLFRKLNFKIPSIIAHYYTLLVIIVGWVLFRAESLNQIKLYLLAMVGRSSPVYMPQEVNLAIWWVLVLIASFLSTVKIDYQRPPLSTLPFFVSWPGYLLIFTMSLSSLITGLYNPFIYFRF